MEASRNFNCVPRFFEKVEGSDFNLCMFVTVLLYQLYIETCRINCVKVGFSTKYLQSAVSSGVNNSELFIGFGYQCGTLINITNKVFLNAKENV